MLTLLAKDGSGSITVQELKTAFETEGSKKSQSLWDEVILQVDQNSDGNISFDEFVKIMENVVFGANKV